MGPSFDNVTPLSFKGLIEFACLIRTPVVSIAILRGGEIRFEGKKELNMGRIMRRAINTQPQAFLDPNFLTRTD